MKECWTHCSDGLKPECHLSAATVAKMTPFAYVPKSTTARSTSKLLHTVFSAVLSCLVPMCAKLCHESSTFTVNFMTLGNYRMHATMFNTFARDVFSSLQNKKCAPVLYTNFEFQFIFRSIEHSTLRSLKCRYMPYVTLRTMHGFVFVTCLGFTLCFFTSIRFIWWMPQTKWYTNAIGIIKASWCQRLTNQWSLYVEHPAVSGPRDFSTSWAI